MYHMSNMCNMNININQNLKVNRIRYKSANSELFRNLLLALNVDLIIVGTWREKIEKETFNIPTIATVNVHPSLLPKYRGPNPYLQTILQGEEYSGVSVHLMTERFDSGPILKQEKIKILETDTSKELREKSVRVARKLIAELITDLNSEVVVPIEQDEQQATYFPNISGNERMLDFKLQDSVSIARTIRALHPFLPCYITYSNKFFIVNPYQFSILSTEYDFEPGTIVEKNHINSSITILCADKVAIRFSELKLYKSPKFTKEFIKNKVNIMDNV